MPGGYLYGWYATTSKWIKVQCTAAGKLIADISGFLENPPTEDEAEKAPTSEWAFDHDADVAAHHAKFTAAEARAAINDIFGSDGKADADIDMAFHDILDTPVIYMVNSGTPNNQCWLSTAGDGQTFRMGGNTIGGGYNQAYVDVYNGTAYERLATRIYSDAAITTHKNIAAAHHAKYTDAEAVAACGLDGTLYWSCPGIHFDGLTPDISDLVKDLGGFLTVSADGTFLIASVELPNGATVTGVIVYGNAAAEAETWEMKRIEFANGNSGILATANIGTADATITTPVIDNSAYSYFIITTGLDTDDAIYGARISYTI